ncbi:hypothetical protein [Paraburkholderia xenovorans]
MSTLGAMIAVTAWLGLYPQPVFDTLASTVGYLQTFASGSPSQAQLK